MIKNEPKETAAATTTTITRRRRRTTTTTTKEAIDRARGVLPIAGQKFPQYFQRYVEFFEGI